MASADNDLERLAATRVLVVGDLMLDRYWFGDALRISPEAPVPVVQVSSTDERMGGAGNVARNVSALGAVGGLVGIVGDDSAGAALAQISATDGIVHQLVVDEGITTCVKQRVVARQQQLLRADFEQEPSVQAVDTLCKTLEQMVEQYDVVVLSDYGKGALADVEQLIDICRKNGKPVLVDPKGADFSRYAGATLITPNLKEFELVAGEVGGDHDLARRARALVDKHSLGGLLVTLSEKGMRYVDSHGETIHSPARTREVYDVSGAGDTVIGMLAMCIAAGIEMVKALHYANVVAGIVVSKLGTATASLEEVRSALQREAVS